MNILGMVFLSLSGMAGYVVYGKYTKTDKEYKRISKGFLLLGLMLGALFGGMTDKRGSIGEDLVCALVCSLGFFCVYLLSLMDEVCGRFSILPLFITMLPVLFIDILCLFTKRISIRELLVVGIFGLILFIFSFFGVFLFIPTQSAYMFVHLMNSL